MVATKYLPHVSPGVPPKLLSTISGQQDRRREKTYCIAVIAEPISIVTKGRAVVAPISASCSAVLYLLIVVGWTSADGSEKSQ